MKGSLNKVAIEYALNAMVEYGFLGYAYWKLMCLYFPFKLFKTSFAHKSEAEMRTHGLSRSFVVASCAIGTRDVAYSDYSGKRSVRRLRMIFRQGEMTSNFGMAGTVSHINTETFMTTLKKE